LRGSTIRNNGTGKLFSFPRNTPIKKQYASENKKAAFNGGYSAVVYSGLLTPGVKTLDAPKSYGGCRVKVNEISLKNSKGLKRVSRFRVFRLITIFIPTTFF